jgi:hypothetical protein
MTFHFLRLLDVLFDIVNLFGEPPFSCPAAAHLSGLRRSAVFGIVRAPRSRGLSE